MSYEIERKFLVSDTSYLEAESGISCRQGYISTEGTSSVRIRIIGEEAYLTLKGADAGIARREFEYRIPPVDAADILDLFCEEPLIEKTRYHITFQGTAWDVDLFHGANLGLCMAEVELEEADQVFVAPPWVGEEVTGQAAYYNVNLICNPYTQWQTG